MCGRATSAHVSLIDGSVLINAPFAAARAALPARPAQREVDRRFVYIDPRPDRFGSLEQSIDRPVGFFAAILGSLSTIPREQPIRDNLEALEKQSREASRVARIVAALRPEVEATVEKLFGMTLFLDRPTAKRLAALAATRRSRRRRTAPATPSSPMPRPRSARSSRRLARIILEAAPGLMLADPEPIALRLRRELDERGLLSLAAPGGGG